jgi:hypothetical protein
MNRIRVFYNPEGIIESVMQVAAKSRTTPVAADHRYVDVSLKETGAETIGELHSCFIVDGNGTLKRRLHRKPVVLPPNTGGRMAAAR